VDWQVIEGDCRDVLATLPADSVDAVITDPPYDLKSGTDRGFMNKAWDGTGVAFDPATWVAVLRVANPGAYLLAFGGTRTYHRLACAIEDAGWYIQDSIAAWLHGQGFPKGRSQLKPAWEPIVLARKPAPRVRPLQIDAARIGATVETWPVSRSYAPGQMQPGGKGETVRLGDPPPGRWPTDVVFSHAPDCAPDVCTDSCPIAELDRQSGMRPSGGGNKRSNDPGMWTGKAPMDWHCESDTGGASRFFPTFRYQSKAPAVERRLPDGTRSPHCTHKPEGLMDWLLRLVARPGDLVLDPFLGSGTTGSCAVRLGCRFIGVEKEPAYVAYARERITAAVPAQPSLVEAAS
jgi:site-specific DNA-methyltransferase (adenine-specific)